MTALLRRLWRRFFWARCRKHDVPFNSDFCPVCVRAMAVRYETRAIVAREHLGRAKRLSRIQMDPGGSR